MKTPNIIVKAFAVSVLLSGCASHVATSADEVRSLTHDQPIIVGLLYVDSKGKPVGADTAATEPIQKVIDPRATPPKTVPVTKPDGTPITWGEFSAAKGTLELSCKPSGTEIHASLEHLIPGGVYTGWMVFFKKPGFAKAQFGALEGLGPVGPKSGARSKFVADADGRATLDAVSPAETVSCAPGGAVSVPPCLLDAYEVHIVGAYQMDGQTAGACEGESSMMAEQIGFMLADGEAQTL